MIHLLDAQTIGQIAAGEVVERPLSVVKELVENAVDAGATRVAVALRAGGIDLVEVVDNGLGIARDDLPLAVRRHATSKLGTASDLESVATLGFRGEGLASIAAVARLTIISRARGEEMGSKIVAYAERTDPIEPAPAPPGTSVSAADLFAGVPVRREYLRSPAAEFNRISSWLSAFALAYPSVAFTLVHDGKESWAMPPAGDLRGRLAMVFGRGAAEAMVELDGRAARDMRGSLSGYISAPGSDRPDRRMQILVVNGRLLRSTLLAGAWTAGYATYTMTGRHPYGVLSLTLPPDHVDPNVHPTKSDVRLRYAHQVVDAVRRAIAATLRDRAAAALREAVAVSLAPPAADVAGAPAPALFDAMQPALGEISEDAGAPRLRVLAQLDATYVAATDGCALILLDQHAAHERIAYEKIVAAARERAPSEPLLVPLTFEVGRGESATLDSALELLREGGLEIERFGERAYRILATPAGYGARPFDVAGLLDDLAGEAQQRDARERVWASLACRSTVRAGERLEPAEMAALLDGLQRCENPMHCPHGRPTIVRFDPDALSKIFKRT